MSIEKVSATSFIAMTIGLVLAIAVPIAIALIWKFKKKERFTTVLIGAATFLLFAIVLEKPIQNVLIIPSAFGLPEHALSKFVSARPVLWGILVGFFPGLFEETGRFVAFKTILRKRINRETGVSHGIGHGGFEVIFILGVTFLEYIIYGVMINTGLIDTVISQVSAQAPGQLATVYEQLNGIAAFGFAELGLMIFERIFAVLYHVGASMLVFYAARDKDKLWLYPLAIIIHTVMDGILGLNIAGVYILPAVAIEAVVVVGGLATFLCAYFLLYRKDPNRVTK